MIYQVLMKSGGQEETIVWTGSSYKKAVDVIVKMVSTHVVTIEPSYDKIVCHVLPHEGEEDCSYIMLRIS